jgi:hypothetical protein
MKGLTLTLPYPYLIAAAATRPDLGKCWETRDWAPPTWRGELAIHAGKNLGPVGGIDGLYDLVTRRPFTDALEVLGLTPEDMLDPSRRGVIVAVAQFRGAGWAIWKDGPAVKWDAAGEDISRVAEPELSFGDYTPVRRIWRLDEIRALATPVRCAGARSLWEVPADVEAAIREQLNGAH